VNVARLVDDAHPALAHEAQELMAGERHGNARVNAAAAGAIARISHVVRLDIRFANSVTVTRLRQRFGRPQRLVSGKLPDERPGPRRESAHVLFGLGRIAAPPPQEELVVDQVEELLQILLESRVSRQELLDQRPLAALPTRALLVVDCLDEGRTRALRIRRLAVGHEL
jgi:hypothetical protein